MRCKWSCLSWIKLVILHAKVDKCDITMFQIHDIRIIM